MADFSSKNKTEIQKSISLHHRMLLGAVTIVSSVLRVYRIDSSFWYDELFSLLNYFRATPLKVITNISNPNNHPLYSLLAKASITLFGEREWSARLPAMVTGIATPPLLYIFAQKRYGVKTALLSSLLLSFNMWHIWFSQDARGYSGMIFLSLCSQIFFINMVENIGKEKSKYHIVPYLLVSACAGYFHLYGVFTPLAHLLIAVIIDKFKFAPAHRKLYLAPFGALVITAVLYSPAFSEMYRYAVTEGRNVAGRKLTWDYLWKLPVEWTGWGRTPLLAIPLIFLWSIGVIDTLKKKRILFTASLLPLALALLFIASARVFTYYRMQSFYLPWFMLFIAAGISATAKKLNRLGLFLFYLISCGALALSAASIYPYYKFGKQPLKDVAIWVDKLSPNIPVYSFGLTDSEFRYYCKRAVEIPFTQSIENVVPHGGIFVSAYPWSWGKKSTETLLRNCRMRRWRAAGYEENDVFVFECPFVGEGLKVR